MLDKVILDSSISVNGWEAGRQDSADISNSGNWTESRYGRAPYPRHKYTIPHTKLNVANRDYLYQFYDGRNGRVRAFLLWDRDFFYIAGQAIGTGDASTTLFPLGVSRGDAANTVYKPALYPALDGTTIPAELRGKVPGVSVTAIEIKVNNVIVPNTDYDIVQGVGGGVDFDTAPGLGLAVTATFWYLTPVRFDGTEFSMTLNGVHGAITPNMIEVFNE